MRLRSACYRSSSGSYNAGSTLHHPSRSGRWLFIAYTCTPFGKCINNSLTCSFGNIASGGTDAVLPQGTVGLQLSEGWTGEGCILTEMTRHIQEHVLSHHVNRTLCSTNVFDSHSYKPFSTHQHRSLVSLNIKLLCSVNVCVMNRDFRN